MSKVFKMLLYLMEYEIIFHLILWLDKNIPFELFKWNEIKTSNVEIQQKVLLWDYEIYIFITCCLSQNKMHVSIYNDILKLYILELRIRLAKMIKELHKKFSLYYQNRITFGNNSSSFLSGLLFSLEFLRHWMLTRKVKTIIWPKAKSKINSFLLTCFGRLVIN